MNRRGFTLIELLIVVVIIGVLAAIAIPKFANTKQKALMASMKTDLRNLVTAEEAYSADSVRYTTDLGTGYTVTTGNVLGTITSGWICDRLGRRGPLAFYYFFRGLSLLFLLFVWNAPSLHVWAAIFGLNYVSTVPPTTTLTANIFGRYSVGELSGWIFLSHQVGSALGAALAGWIYEWTGGYEIAFVSAALMGFLAAGLALAIREEPVASRPTPLAAPATS